MESRNPEDYPDRLKFILDELTMNETPKVVGSTAFLVHKFPSDVDVFESTMMRVDRETALEFYQNAFQNIIQKILVDVDLFYLDFKAGEDVRFNQEDQTQTEMIERLLRENLISRQEADQLIKMYLDEFEEALRQKRVLRWSPEEILEGKKSLPCYKTITLKEALSQPAVVKLDTAAWILGRYQSIEVFYSLQYDPGTGPIAFYPLGSYVHNLMEDVNKYSSIKYYSPLKLAKRLWSLARVINCQELMDELGPLFSSDSAALNQIQSDAELLIDLLSLKDEKSSLSHYDSELREKNIREVFMELLGFEKRIINHLSLFQYKRAKPLLSQFFQYWVHWINTRELSREPIILLLEKIRELLMEEILGKSEVFLKDVTAICRRPELNISTVAVPSIYSH